MANIEDVRSYWNAHPLLSYELTEVGSPDFFDKLDSAKRTVSERFAMDYWNFNGFVG